LHGLYPALRGCYACAVKISIIVPAFNEEALLGASLVQIKSAAAAFSKIGWETELIVCDNNSTDRTADIARAAGATVVFEPVNQIARARNVGAAAATGDWLVFVDADSHPSAELFADVTEQIRSGRCLAGGVTIRLDEKHFAGGLITAAWNCASRTFKLPAGSFIFCDAAVFREVGGFSNEMFAGEELELTQRLKQFARGQARGIVILHRHPILTSTRKMRLYTAREHLRFFAFALFNKRRALTSRKAAHLWYDGRR
jgi:cellulose synthase/poly-beta-1,6-N-acetylglucosamine synthase-like glycosyltransferase